MKHLQLLQKFMNTMTQAGSSVMRNKQRFYRYLALLLLIFSLPVTALINPEDANQPIPDWMVRIYVIDRYSSAPYLFCHGALIDKEWVVSTRNCFFDPYHILEFASGGEEPEFKVMIGTSSQAVKVSYPRFSDDSQLAMFQLDEQVSNKPLKQTTATVNELMNQNVRILGRQKSVPAGDPFYNPGGGRNVTCKINGRTFFSAGALCHIFSFPSLASTLQQTRATIINPKAPTAPATALDKLLTFDTTGARLYLDFRAHNSYPCLEDLGLPVIRTTSSGETEMVGIIAGVSVLAGVPMCTPALVNRTLAISYYKDFIEKTLITADFNKQCPVTPKLEITYTGGNGIRLDWNAVGNADGYTLHYTTREGYSTIKTVDMLNNRTLTVDISPSVRYTVAVMAYNSSCTSQLSEPLPVSLNRIDIQ
jgi:hypothetical protein